MGENGVQEDVEMDLGLPWQLQSSLLPSGEGAGTIRMQSASQVEKVAQLKVSRGQKEPLLWTVCGHTQQWPPGQRTP